MDDVDDTARAPLDHMRTHATAHVPGAVQIEIDHRTPAAVADLSRRGGKLTAGVVDQKIDAAEALDGLLNQRLDLIDVANVGGHGQAANAGVDDLFGRPVQVLSVAAGDDDIGAKVGKGQGDTPTYAAPTAGN